MDPGRHTFRLNGPQLAHYRSLTLAHLGWAIAHRSRNQTRSHLLAVASERPLRLEGLRSGRVFGHVEGSVDAAEITDALLSEIVDRPLAGGWSYDRTSFSKFWDGALASVRDPLLGPPFLPVHVPLDPALDLLGRRPVMFACGGAPRRRLPALVHTPGGLVAGAPGLIGVGPTLCSSRLAPDAARYRVPSQRGVGAAGGEASVRGETAGSRGAETHRPPTSERTLMHQRVRERLQRLGIMNGSRGRRLGGPADGVRSPGVGRRSPGGSVRTTARILRVRVRDAPERAGGGDRTPRSRTSSDDRGTDGG